MRRWLYVTIITHINKHKHGLYYTLAGNGEALAVDVLPGRKDAAPEPLLSGPELARDAELFVAVHLVLHRSVPAVVVLACGVGHNI